MLRVSKMCCSPLNVMIRRELKIDNLRPKSNCWLLACQPQQVSVQCFLNYAVPLLTFIYKSSARPSSKTHTHQRLHVAMQRCFYDSGRQPCNPTVSVFIFAAIGAANCRARQL